MKSFLSTEMQFNKKIIIFWICFEQKLEDFNYLQIKFYHLKIKHQIATKYKMIKGSGGWVGLEGCWIYNNQFEEFL